MKWRMIIPSVLMLLLIGGVGIWYARSRSTDAVDSTVPSVVETQNMIGGDTAVVQSGLSGTPLPPAESSTPSVDESRGEVLGVLPATYSDDPGNEEAALEPGDPAYDKKVIEQRRSEQEIQKSQGAIIPQSSAGTGGGSVVPILEGSADPDLDGLTNDQELQLGTNRTRSDSDNDGLKDGEEVRTYRSDPLKSDTDGDGYDDGTEVKGGYNPNGPGKL